MATFGEFIQHTTAGRVLLVVLFLVISLLIASVLGWLPALH